MTMHHHRPIKLISSLLLVLAVVFCASPADVALAQTQPELTFLNGSVASRAKHGDAEAREKCKPPFDTDVETASTTVFVLLKGASEPTSVKFVPEMPAVAKGRLDPASYNQITSQNRIKVLPEAAMNERPGSGIKPSEVKAFKVTFLICSNDNPPGWLYYVINNAIPPEWANLTGQLVVKDAGQKGVAPGTVSVQLNRPALGYEKTYFIAILVITVLLGVLLTAWIRHDVDSGRLNDPYPADFKSGFVAPLTTATAILGTVLSTTVLPNDTFFMPKGEYAALNVLFGLVALVAAVIHNNYDTKRSFWVAAGLTLGAASGEIITVLFILKEMGFQGSLPAQIVWIFQILLFVTGIGLILMAKNKVADEIDKVPQSPPRDPVAGNKSGT